MTCDHTHDSCECWADEPDTPTCPECDGDGVPLGSLGKVAWSRCRQCGLTYGLETS